ncbi:MAG: nitroreductase family protein [bacterium]
MNSIYTRRSVRQFSDKEVEHEKIIQLLKAGMQAPSAMNQQAHQYFVLTDKETQVELSVFKQGGKLVSDGNVTIIICGNEEIMKSPPMWQQDLGAAAQNISLEAVNLGLGSVWLGCAPHEDRMSKVSEVLNLPAHIKPYAVLSIGYPLNEDANKFVDRYNESKVTFGKYK